MLTAIVIVAALIAALLAYAAMRPDRFTLQRSAVIAAPPERIYPLIADFHNWTLWSPWEKLDPDLRRTYEGPPSGLGAAYAWDGKGKAGAGRMEIVEAAPPSRVGIRLEFTRPFAAGNDVDFVLQPQAGGTAVTWTMRGRSPFVAKLMGVFFSMDKMVGKDFEAGLASMKQAAETG